MGRGMGPRGAAGSGFGPARSEDTLAGKGPRAPAGGGFGPSMSGPGR